MLGSELFLNFLIPSSGPWPLTSASGRSEEELIAEITSIQAKVVAASLDPQQAEFIISSRNFLQLSYLQECLVGEAILPAGSTIEHLEKALQESPDTNRTARKIQNLRLAVTDFLPYNTGNNPATINTRWATFTPNLLQDMHPTIGYKLILNAGSYRTGWCSPAQEDWAYLPPHLVMHTLAPLCTRVRRALEAENNHHIGYRIRLAASFMTNFLHIHPFSNGNGRVARLAVSWLLADITIVPIPLTSSNGRQHVLEALRDSRHLTPFTPLALSRILLESAFHTVRKAHFSLDL
ncbi:hypothetical protein PSTG_13064 [Puccinia striiformis f. sp. tritici PST-78]|uniref:Fido domain-containing protein n=1 Tax=Puccinia striiformis f. sp. tritici PST-78 TaxID=1165861 RepID=A0A0L0V2Z6_9BASI|nr:hypothetical protein PSTG_13064 [Puccinia striiformis f. sp. tritici PST-78]